MLDFFDMLLGTLMYYIEKYANIFILAMVINALTKLIGGLYVQ